MRDPGERVILYPHAGEREWSTIMRDEWKRDLGVEYVRADRLQESRARLRDLLTQVQGDRKQLVAENALLREALQRILDHGKTHEEPCRAIHNGDCADVFQEIARATLSNP